MNGRRKVRQGEHAASSGGAGAGRPARPGRLRVKADLEEPIARTDGTLREAMLSAVIALACLQRSRHARGLPNKLEPQCGEVTVIGPYHEPKLPGDDSAGAVGEG